jgi:hypothetical protein
LPKKVQKYLLPIATSPVSETLDPTKAAGGEIVAHQCDVTDAASVEVMVVPVSIGSGALIFW